MTPQERAAALLERMGLCGHPAASQFVGDIIEHDQQTRRAALLEVSRRLLPNAQSVMLDAPCLWCGYNGEGYWQPTTHELTCLWHNVGGRFDRVVALDRLAQEG